MKTVVILAAGKGTRMKSKTAKVLHPLAGVPMICYPVNTSKALDARVIVVLGYQADAVKQVLSHDVEIAFQTEQKGTGHAVACARGALTSLQDFTIILYGDVPLLKKSTLARLIETTEQERATLGFITTHLANPSGYGRILRDHSGHPLRIVEEKDASPEERKITEINSGIYCIHTAFLLSALDQLKSNNVQQEYYLTDIVEIAVRHGEKIITLAASDPEEVLGINDRVELARANQRIQREILEKWMREGVTVMDPDTTYIDLNVHLEPDTTLFPMVSLYGKTQIGAMCSIETGSVVQDSIIGEGVTIKPYSVITSSRVDHHAQVGPFSHLRPASHLEEGAKVGNFVEMKKSTLGPYSKANHLSYLGDATIGTRVNIGAGTITCNYDGEKKHPTLIEDGSFIGSDTQLVAPVKVGKNAYIGSGTTVTKDVPENALAVSRVQQTNIKDWVLRRKKTSTES